MSGGFCPEVPQNEQSACVIGSVMRIPQGIDLRDQRVRENTSVVKYSTPSAGLTLERGMRGELGGEGGGGGATPTPRKSRCDSR